MMLVFSQFEAYISFKFLSDGKGRPSGLHAAFGGKVNVIKHGSYFGLDIRRHSWLRNSYLEFGIIRLRTLHVNASFWV